MNGSPAGSEDVPDGGREQRTYRRVECRRLDERSTEPFRQRTRRGRRKVASLDDPLDEMRGYRRECQAEMAVAEGVDHVVAKAGGAEDRN